MSNEFVTAVTEQNIPPLTALDILNKMSPVEGDELDILLAEFQTSLVNVIENSTALGQMYCTLTEINPSFLPAKYSDLPKADVLANVVAAFYAPLIHGFSTMVLKNIKSGELPSTIMAPPRDTYPIVTSLQALSQVTQTPIHILQPPVTRKTAGVYNNQNGAIEGKHPLFDQMISQLLARVTGGVVEVEFGIYSTTSLVVAKQMQQINHETLTPLKFYALGPNLSWVHALLSGNETWIAQEAELQGLVDPYQIANLMVLTDSLEEFGMQNWHKTIKQLIQNDQGLVVSVIEPVDSETLEIAKATNNALKATANQYATVTPEKIIDLINAVPQMIEFAKHGFPVMLTKCIPPMDNHQDHFAAIKSSQAFYQPQLVL